MDSIKKFGKYEVIDILGEGGMGVVYRAIDKGIGRKVAIKTLKRVDGDAEMVQRFYHEAEKTGVLNHPNIVTVYVLGQQDGSPYIVMEYLEGESLDVMIRSGREIPLAAKLRIITEVCSALGYAHRNNVIHRDIKPANVIVQLDGTAKLLDFGIAVARREHEVGITRVGSVIGTVLYMAPERLRGEAFDGRSDIFSAGVMLYQLLTGELPFGRDDVAVVQKVFSENFPPLSKYLASYPAALDPILERALAKTPYERYATAEEMSNDLAMVAREVKRDEVLKMLPQAERFVVGHEFTRAREILLDILRIDGQHSGAKRLLAEVQRQLTQRQREESVLRLRMRAEDARRDKQFDQAIACLEDALKLDSSASEIPRLLESVRQEKRTREQSDIYLREADAARQVGDFEKAKAIVQKALELDKQNSKVIAAHKVIEREVEEADRKDRARKLIESARRAISSRNFTAAMGMLREADGLDSTNPDLQPLMDEATQSLEHEQRRKIVDEIHNQAAVATNFDEIQRAFNLVNGALARMPAETSLIKLKAELQRKISEEENRKFVEDTVQHCRSLDPREAVQLVRQALYRMPGEERLLGLQSILEDRLRKKSVEEAREQRLSQAREALDRKRYADAIRILEGIQSEGTTSSEIVELLAFARNEASRQDHRQFVEGNCSQAQAFLANQDYDSAAAILEAGLRQSESPELRKLLEHVQVERQSLLQRIDAVLERVRALLETKQTRPARQLIESESPSVVRDVRIQAALIEICSADEREWEMLQLIGKAYSALAKQDMKAGRGSLDEALRTCEQSAVAQSMSMAFQVRRKTLADATLLAAMERLRAASANGDAESAILAVGSTAGILEYANSELKADWQRLQKQAGKSRKLGRIKGKLFG